jgi:Holliday junction resolvase RusA-like endonuclease
MLCETGNLIPKRPDIDNIAKAIMDACNHTVFVDDAQIWHLSCFKRYCDVGQKPHVHVKVQWDEQKGEQNIDRFFV